MTCCLPVPSTMGTGEEVASILGVRHDMLFISTLETNQDSISRHPTIPISLTPLPPLWCGNIEVKESGAMRGVGGGGKLSLLLLMAFAQGWLVRDTGYGIGTGYGIPDTGPSVSVIRTDHPVLKGFVFVKVQFASLRRARTRQSCCSRSFCANSCGSGRKELVRCRGQRKSEMSYHGRTLRHNHQNRDQEDDQKVKRDEGYPHNEVIFGRRRPDSVEQR